jgi:hypothetical protein
VDSQQGDILQVGVSSGDKNSSPQNSFSYHILEGGLDLDEIPGQRFQIKENGYEIWHGMLWTPLTLLITGTAGGGDIVTWQ